eukprot:1153944-Pelagomonas_calceolata.AAC.4
MGGTGRTGRIGSTEGKGGKRGSEEAQEERAAHEAWAALGLFLSREHTLTHALLMHRHLMKSKVTLQSTDGRRPVDGMILWDHLVAPRRCTKAMKSIALK